ncbi:ENTH/VHS domain-containing protein Ent3 [Schizosaccharomyces cryophilus OY26]|uniref:ENTH/VHS domain-containing protein Ent3 n=1 Tax=Schizosaccharomyces cryophilus (strain OY26 / ATCC MYA-4695 / CBS 11777 / NBRC 106824 / NRRL Y48691) TaxID=653667 RepID=S9WZ92_SCHCR|nr:ENTH/VHS domain-containing protein Ent3 [Schizosaccharomyces cryophilus OY26]EPY50032.1 ENTH/VHS domain-containing protein Ent3 [Schizosaccharomyces cryophilus OY26]
MDGLQSSIKNINLYDVKAAVRKAQNVVMNYTSTEAKVREATNNEPWGASTSLMMEIAQGTHNYSQLNEIMPMVYRRFTEKTAEEWRQIYKALQLLEFLVKNGSERVIDDARAHQATIKMLRNFHYIDRYQRDQGLNVRTRAKELVELLNDNDRIRQERRKARQTRGKYFGVGSDGDARVSSGSRPRFSGFGGSPRTASYRNRVYGDGGGFTDFSSGGGFRDSSSYSDTHDHSEYDEYNENHDSAGPHALAPRATPRATRNAELNATSVSSPPKQEQQSAVADLLGLDEPAATVPPSSTMPTSSTTAAVEDDDDGFGEFQTSSALPTAATVPGNDDDDAFDDFQSAPSVPSASVGMGNMASFNSLPSLSSSVAGPSFGNGASSNVGTPTFVGLSSQNLPSSNQVTQTAKVTKAGSSGGDAFGSLWSSAVTKVKHDDHSKLGTNPPQSSMAPAVSTSSIPATSNLLSSDDNNLLL